MFLGASQYLASSWHTEQALLISVECMHVALTCAYLPPIVWLHLPACSLFSLYLPSPVFALKPKSSTNVSLVLCPQEYYKVLISTVPAGIIELELIIEH